MNGFTQLDNKTETNHMSSTYSNPFLCGRHVLLPVKTQGEGKIADEVEDACTCRCNICLWEEYGEHEALTDGGHRVDNHEDKDDRDVRIFQQLPELQEDI